MAWVPHNKLFCSPKATTSGPRHDGRELDPFLHAVLLHSTDPPIHTFKKAAASHLLLGETQWMGPVSGIPAWEILHVQCDFPFLLPLCPWNRLGNRLGVGVGETYISPIYSQSLGAPWEVGDEIYLSAGDFEAVPIRAVAEGRRAQFRASTYQSRFQQEQELKELWYPQHLPEPIVETTSLPCAALLCRERRHDHSSFPWEQNRGNLLFLQKTTFTWCSLKGNRV